MIEARPNLSSISTFVDSYDPVGNRVGRVQDASAVYTWSYDAANRLLGQRGPGGLAQAGWATFSYDPLGNVLVKQHQGEPPRTMSYDAASRLATLVFGAATTSYTYDGAGNLRVETTSGVSTGLCVRRGEPPR